jgi:hypothetical protein
LAKSLGRLQGFKGKIASEPPILGFIAFLLISFSKLCLGGAVSSSLV